MDDCKALKPALFPSVPRLYNRFYQKLSEKIQGATGCKGWLANKALNTKLGTVRRSGQVTNGCWDSIVFKKVAAELGGRVRYMITASAPIDGKVLEFLKVAFCCPVLEGYGLTETSGAASTT